MFKRLKIISVCLVLTIACSSSTQISEKDYRKKLNNFCISTSKNLSKETSKTEDIIGVLEALLKRTKAFNKLVNKYDPPSELINESNILKDSTSQLIDSYSVYLKEVKAAKGNYDDLDPVKFDNYGKQIDKADKLISVALSNIGAKECGDYNG